MHLSPFNSPSAASPGSAASRTTSAPPSEWPISVRLYLGRAWPSPLGVKQAERHQRTSATSRPADQSASSGIARVCPWKGKSGQRIKGPRLEVLLLVVVVLLPLLPLLLLLKLLLLVPPVANRTSSPAESAKLNPVAPAPCRKISTGIASGCPAGSWEGRSPWW